MKWLELTIELYDYSRTNEFLASIVKPYVGTLYAKNIEFSWHFFREPSICWRFYAEDNIIVQIGQELDALLTNLEKEQPDLYKEHYNGAFLQRGLEYKGEADFYGADAWELCYKRWEAGSNLALQLISTKSFKPIYFHADRDIHLFLNQLGYTIEQESLFNFDRARRLSAIYRATHNCTLGDFSAELEALYNKYNDNLSIDPVKAYQNDILGKIKQEK